MTWVIAFLLIIAIIFFLTREESVGKVEIVETDGKYAVRQFGYRSKDDCNKIIYKSYEEQIPEWLWFNEKGEIQYLPVDMTLFEAKNVASMLNDQYEEFITKEKE